MDVLVEILMEVLGTLVFEGGEEAATDHRLPRWLRLLLLGALAVAYLAVFVLILVAGVAAFREVPLVSLLLFALDAGLVFLTVRKLRKILRTLSRQ